MGCTRLDTDFLFFLEVETSKERARNQKKDLNVYPFGLEHKGYGAPRISNHPYKFGGKEFNEELGLDWYDVSARNYDPALGRWMNVDPLAEKYYAYSPYAYVMNNPLRHTDPTGMSHNDVIVNGADADAVVDRLNQESSFGIVRDSNTGKLSTMGPIDESKLTGADKELYNVINDETKIVNLDTTRDLNRVDSSGNTTVVNIGVHSGQNESEAFQEINLIQSDNLAANGGQSSATTIRHEIFEGSEAVNIVNPNRENSFTLGIFPSIQNATRNVYNQAHTQSAALDYNYDTRMRNATTQRGDNGATLWMNFQPNAQWSNANGWFKLQ